MRILLVLPRPLLPADMGGKIRSLNMFSRLARKHPTTCLCLVPNGTESVVLAETAHLFEKFVPIYWQDVRTSSPLFYWEFLKSQASENPYGLYRYCVPALQAALRKRLETDHVDVLLFDFLHTAVNLPSGISRPTVLFTHNVESQIWRRRSELEAHPVRRLVLQREYWKMRRMEELLCKRFDLVLTVSRQDRVQLEKEFGVPLVRDVPTGVDTSYFSSGNGRRKKFNLVFVGAMDWYPNEDAVIYFVRELYPRVRSQIPGVTLTVVGRNPTQPILRLPREDASIEVTGWVEDVRPFVARADCCVVPLRIGGGTRVKIFEAMAMAKPVVTTAVGAEGLPVLSGHDVIVADGSDEFGAAVVRILREPVQAEQLGMAARRTVFQNFGWETVVNRLEQFLSEICHAHDRESQCLGATG